MKIPALIPLAAVVGLLAGCVGGGTPSSGNSGVGGGEANQPVFRVVDLENGFAGNLTEIRDLHSNSAYKDHLMVFRWVPSGTAQLGTRHAVLGEVGADDAISSQEVPGFYISVWEVTQAQWAHIARQSPWLDVNHPGSVGSTSTAGSKPAFNISLEQAELALASFDGADLDLPSNVQWEYAARGGSTGMFPWGDRLDAGTAGRFAAVHSTVTAPGVVTVGSKEANGFGLYDTAGNVYELTREGDVRGGSWASNLMQARCANKVDGEELVENGVVGVRLVIR